MAKEIRLSKIDSSNREDHWHLTEDDACFYLFEYTSQRDYSFSSTNGLIKNLKKKPSASNQPGYRYKSIAIRECSVTLGDTLNPKWLKRATLVPVPCSKIVGHPDYDDRIEQICRGIAPNLDVRTIVTQSQSTVASHEAGANRLSVQDLLDVYQVNVNLRTPTPATIGIVDDVLTAGTHYKAMKTVLSEEFPEADIFGIFVARRVFPDPFGEEE